MIGRILSHYEILGEISRGGMGIVYRARDTKLNREVALKVLPPELVADEERRRRFFQEAQAAAALKHPHIGVIYEIDEAEDVTFMALELIEGDKLGDLLKRNPLSLARVLDLAIEIAEGLSSAHQKSIIHRDLKPGNVMVTEEGHAKIIDFGLAKLIEPLDERESEGETSVRRETDPGMVMGTASYMSPEQARGRKVDHRSDVFSFGILLYEMLSGQLPFQTASGVETLNAIMKEPPRPLTISTGSTGDLQRAELERIIRKCLAKEPDERYQTIKDLVVDLKTVRRASDSDISVTMALAPSSPTRRPLVLGAAAAAALALAAAIGFLLLGGSSSETESTGDPAATKPSVAILFFDNQSGDPELDWLRTALTDMLVTDMSQSPNMQVLSTDRLYQIMEELNRLDERVTSFTVVQELAERAHVDRVVLGSFVRAGDTIRINVRVQDAESGEILTSEQVEGVGEASIFPMVDDLNRRIKISFDIPEAAEVEFDRGLSEVSTSSPEAYRHYVEGLKLHFDGRYRDAIPHFEKAVEVDPEFALALARLGIVHGNLGHARESELYTARAFENAEHLPGRERYYIEGNYYGRRAETSPQSIAAYERALELYPDHFAARNNLALQLLQTGRLDESIEHYERLRGEGFPFPAAHGALGATYIARGEPQKALDVFDDFVRDHPESASGRRFLSVGLQYVGQLDEAEEVLNESKRLGGETRDFWNDSWRLRALRERWVDAEAAASSNAMSDDPTARADGLRRQAMTELYRGRLDEALDRLEDEVRVFAEPQRDTAGARNYRARVLLETGEPARALLDAQLARRADPGHLGEYRGLYLSALAHARMEQWEDAEATANLLRERIEPRSSPWETARQHQLLGEIALARGNHVRAIEEIERAASLLPPRGIGGDPPHVLTWFSLASAQMAAGNRDEALPWFQRVVDSGSEHVFWPIPYVRSFYFLGKIYESRGETDRAREHFQRFVDFWKVGDLDRERVDEALTKL